MLISISQSRIPPDSIVDFSNFFHFASLSISPIIYFAKFWKGKKIVGEIVKLEKSKICEISSHCEIGSTRVSCYCWMLQVYKKNAVRKGACILIRRLRNAIVMQAYCVWWWFRWFRPNRLVKATSAMCYRNTLMVTKWLFIRWCDISSCGQWYLQSGKVTIELSSQLDNRYGYLHLQ